MVDVNYQIKIIAKEVVVVIILKALMTPIKQAARVTET